MIVLTPRCTPGVPELTLFDTQVPHDHPVSSRRFHTPLRYRGWYPSIHVDSHRCLGTPDQNRPLATDPTQAILAIKLVSHDGPRVLLVVRIQTLIEHVRSTGAGACVPWDKWGRDSVVMELPTRSRPRNDPHPLVQGVRVMFVEVRRSPGLGGDLRRPHLFTFDLSRRGCSVLPLRDEGDGIERRVLFGNGQKFILQGDGQLAGCEILSLADDQFMCLVGHFRVGNVAVD